jgi:hypothetical protein
MTKLLNVYVTKANHHFAANDYVAENEVEVYKTKMAEILNTTVEKLNFRFRPTMNMKVEFIKDGDGINTVAFVDGKFKIITYKKVR